MQPGVSGEQLAKIMSNLARGDTLRLAPGVYDVGSTPVFACHADAAHRITVTALDPTNPPLLRGWLYFNSPDYWTVSRLRVEATVAGQGAIQMAGGVGWVIDGVELFGTAGTFGMGALAIGSRDNAGPRDFTVINSCLHDGPLRRADAGYHGIYATARGSGPSASGLIANNVIYGFPDGGGVKVGAGGAAGTVGPWNVRVVNNTITQSGFGVVLHGRLNSTVVSGNLIGNLFRKPSNTYPGVRSAAVYAHLLDGRRNAVANNYTYRTDMMLRLTGKGRPRVAKSNVRGRAPAFVGQGCDARVVGGRAAGYGRRG